jgi:hypothetical protein
VPSYLVETYLGRGRAKERAALEQRARSAAERMSSELRLVRFDHSLHVPDDEICFYVFEAQSADDVAQAARRAGLDALRVVEAISSGEEYR